MNLSGGNSYRRLDEEVSNDHHEVHDIDHHHHHKKNHKRNKKKNIEKQPLLADNIHEEEAKNIDSENEGGSKINLIQNEEIISNQQNQVSSQRGDELSSTSPVDPINPPPELPNSPYSEKNEEISPDKPLISSSPPIDVASDIKITLPESSKSTNTSEMEEKVDDLESHPLVIIYQCDSDSNQSQRIIDQKLQSQEIKSSPTKPPKPTQKAIDENLNKQLSSPVNKTGSLNPFDDSSSNQEQRSTNPFDPNYQPPPSKGKSNPIMNNAKNMKPKSTNPFDSDDADIPPAPQKNQSFKSGSSNPFDSNYQVSATPATAPVAKGSPKLTKSSSSPSSIETPPQSPTKGTRFTENSPEYSDLVTLLRLGFLPLQAYQSLVKNKDLSAALHSLRTDLITALIQKSSPNWYPPVLSRIGSWMPSQTNSSSRVLYYIKVQLNHSDLAYVITKRYSEFVTLHQKLTPYLYRNCQNLPSQSSQSGDPNNILIPFVDDRISGYLWGTSEELCNRRQDMLHKWLSFLCLSERMMTDIDIHNLVMDFFQIDHYVKRIPVLTGIPERPLKLQ